MKEIKTDSKQFQNVLAKAIEKKPVVRLGAEDGLYFVDGSQGNRYAVCFQIGAGGRRLGACFCRGAMKGFYCYHLAAALMVHSAFVSQGLRAPAPRRERGYDDAILRGLMAEASRVSAVAAAA